MLFEVKYSNGDLVGVDADRYVIETDSDKIVTTKDGMPVQFFMKSEIVEARANGRVVFENCEYAPVGQHFLKNVEKYFAEL